jgi:hypothetical protein
LTGRQLGLKKKQGRRCFFFYTKPKGRQIAGRSIEPAGGEEKKKKMSSTDPKQAPFLKTYGTPIGLLVFSAVGVGAGISGLVAEAQQAEADRSKLTQGLCALAIIASSAAGIYSVAKIKSLSDEQRRTREKKVDDLAALAK